MKTLIYALSLRTCKCSSSPGGLKRAASKRPNPPSLCRAQVHNWEIPNSASSCLFRGWCCCCFLVYDVTELLVRNVSEATALANLLEIVVRARIWVFVTKRSTGGACYASSRTNQRREEDYRRRFPPQSQSFALFCRSWTKVAALRSCIYRHAPFCSV